MRILHVATELHPLIKVGGLGDVVAALPPEQAHLGHDPRILIPGYPAVMGSAQGLTAASAVPGGGRLLHGYAPSGIPLYVLDAPKAFGGSGGPYARDMDPCGYRLLGEAALLLAMAGDDAGWRPQVVHAHDWPAALAPAYLAHGRGPRPATVITVHNAAYQGLLPAASYPELGLPPEAYCPEGVEFHGQVSLLKAGLRYADRITTVSPTYARELQTPEGGMGLDGLFRHRAADLVGILNGIDTRLWDPAHDAALLANYTAETLALRPLNRAVLLDEGGLDPEAEGPLFAVVSRLDPLKGLDLLLEALPEALAAGARLVVLGTGAPSLEAGFQALAEAYPGRAVLAARHDETLAHRIFAGADFLVVPSRSEPCGLTQLYAQRYGAVPVVRRTGGLADTVVDPLENPSLANGLTFEDATSSAVAQALRRARELFTSRPADYQQLQRQGMSKDSGWGPPAHAYLNLYHDLMRSPHGSPGSVDHPGSRSARGLVEA